MNNIKQLKLRGRSILLRPAQDAAEHKGSLVLLHGYGADEYDLMGLAPYFDTDMDVICIRAPGSTPYGGASWFDINMLADGGLEFNAPQALTSCSDLILLVTELQATGVISQERIMLGGFSQGASMATLVTLSRPELIKGLLIMSGRLTEGVQLLIHDRELLKGLPVFAGHGTLDQVIPIEFGRQIVTFWKNLPVQLEHHEYDMGHEIQPSELMHIQSWFDRELL